jgi:hypothetical protein
MIDENSDANLDTWRGGVLPLPDFGASKGRENSCIHHTETARVLSGIERFGARTQKRYTVAEHSVRVAWCVQDMGGTNEEQWAAINHEGDEAVLGFDPASPIVAICPDLRELKWRAHLAYCRRYGLDTSLPMIVKQADVILLMTERRDLMRPPPRPWHASLEAVAPLPKVIEPMGAEQAAHVFLYTWLGLAKLVGYAGEG